MEKLIVDKDIAGDEVELNAVSDTQNNANNKGITIETKEEINYDVPLNVLKV